MSAYRFLSASFLSLLAIALVSCTPVSHSTPPATMVPMLTAYVEEERVAEVQWPGSMRVGDTEVITLRFFPPNESGVEATAIPEYEIAPSVIPLVIERNGYTGYISAELAAVGLAVESVVPTEQILLPGQANIWHWAVQSDSPGTYRVAVSLVVRWEPDLGQEIFSPFEEVVWAKVLTIQTRTVFGLSGKQIDRVSLAGTLLGSVASIPFLEKVIEYLWRNIKLRRLKKKEKESF